jgi:glucose-1-phosphate cytidylyltransferase
MKAVILAGGKGTRLSEETIVKPKPMVEIGGKPILWHIMKILSMQGINEFIICLGMRGYQIKEYFSNYFLHMSDVTFDMKDNTVEIHKKKAEPWTVTLVDTGLDTATGGRLLQASRYLDDEPFCFTYGDGVANIDLKALLDFHHREGRLATVTAVQPPGRFGALAYTGSQVLSFQEKPQGDGGWINGGYFILSPDVIPYIKDENIPWEATPLEQLARENQLSAYFHTGFWYPMDTMRDKNYLEDLWNTGTAPWKIW